MIRSSLLMASVAVGMLAFATPAAADTPCDDAMSDIADGLQTATGPDDDEFCEEVGNQCWRMCLEEHYPTLPETAACYSECKNNWGCHD